MLKKIIIYFLIEYAYSYILKTNKIIEPRDGCDERYPIKPDNSLELKNIIDNYRKYELLNKLTSNQISKIDKLNLIERNLIESNLIERNQIKPLNITNGGLFDDFNFNFDIN